MKRTGTGPTRRIGRLLPGLALLGLAACISSPVTVDASDAAPLSRSATLHVALAPRAEPADTPTPGETDSGVDPALDPALASALRAQAERALVAKGYAIGSASDSDLVLELDPRQQLGARRTWSSDPDASATRIVKKTEAVLAIRARRGSDGLEIWRCDARAQLPESARSPGERADEIWSRILSRALESVPDRG